MTVTDRRPHHKGNTGERFYIINDGEVVVTVQQGSGKPKELTRLSTQVSPRSTPKLTLDPKADP